ncbi:MAG TPA: DUF3108 domain-containing protein [Gammaproteobacteria bacterium]|nr:DUF3108 domain-containing protein [Gammaproteobacteria bacterium]
MIRTTPGIILFAGCLLLAFSSAHAESVQIPLYHASYTVSRNDLQIGVAEFSLIRNPDGSYSYKSVTQPTGLAALFFSDIITESSQFTVEDGKPESLRYDYTNSNNSHDDAEHIQFDWSRQIADCHDGKRHKILKIEPGIHDRALAQLAVSLDLAAGRLADAYRVLDHNQITSYRMEREPDEKLKTQNWAYQTVKVARKDAKKKRTTTFWLVPELHYLPAQIEQTEPGKATITLTMTEIKFDITNSK